MKDDKKILIAGANGMVGSALKRALKSHNLLTPKRKELDFADQRAVRSYLSDHQPDVIIIAAAKVGGSLPIKTILPNFCMKI